MFQDKQIRIISKLAIIVLIVLVGFFVYSKFLRFKLEKSIETKPPTLSLTTDSNIFGIENIIVYSSANALNNSEMQLDYWDLNLYQYNDISIKINNHVSIDDFTKKNTIKEMYIDNISYPRMPKQGTPTLFYKNPVDMGNAIIDESKLIDQRIDFNVLTENDEDAKEPSFYMDCSNPFVLSSVNMGIEENLEIRNTKSAITFDGNLLLDADILLSKITYEIDFDIHIINNLDEEYVCMVALPIELTDENGYKTIYDGSYSVAYTDLKTTKFFKVEHE